MHRNKIDALGTCYIARAFLSSEKNSPAASFCPLIRGAYTIVTAEKGNFAKTLECEGLPAFF